MFWNWLRVSKGTHPVDYFRCSNCTSCQVNFMEIFRLSHSWRRSVHRQISEILADLSQSCVSVFMAFMHMGRMLIGGCHGSSDRFCHRGLPFCNARSDAAGPYQLMAPTYMVDGNGQYVLGQTRGMGVRLVSPHSLLVPASPSHQGGSLLPSAVCSITGYFVANSSKCHECKSIAVIMWSWSHRVSLPHKLPGGLGISCDIIVLPCWAHSK